MIENNVSSRRETNNIALYHLNDGRIRQNVFRMRHPHETNILDRLGWYTFEMWPLYRSNQSK